MCQVRGSAVSWLNRPGSAPAIASGQRSAPIQLGAEAGATVLPLQASAKAMAYEIVAQ